MNCADFEIPICEYVDGALPAAQKAELERHLAECPACAEMARDSAAAVAFMERAADVEPPPEMITRILFEGPWNKGKAKQPAWRKWISGVLGPVLSPKFAMSMALTILSLSMLFKFVSPTPRSPAKILTNLEDQAYRAWGRTVKFYDNLKFVYQIQTTLRQWQQRQQSDEQRAPVDQGTAGAGVDARKLPVASPTGQSGGAPPSKVTGGSR
jgi:anti-sigma factor RsiW